MGPKACRLNWETAAIHTAFVAVVVEEHRELCSIAATMATKTC